MALAQHSSIQVRFNQQVENSQTYLIPFIRSGMKLEAGMRVMEIGCGEGGVLKPFTGLGLFCLGVDLSETRIADAQKLMEPEGAKGLAEFVVKNVWDEDFREKYQNSFDLIILKDTIEHIPGQETFIPYLKEFLKENGKIFFGFPPWRMPFGGHQQISHSKMLGVTPWIHLLPRPLYRGVLKIAGESDRIVEDLMEIRDTQISINRFERIISQSNFRIDRKKHYFINPIYQYKFGLKPREQAKIVTAIPHFRDFFTTAGWYLVSASK
ncbi:MAG: class I SAM-dependent methyltransferase [Bacteroidia bacterium]